MSKPNKPDYVFIRLWGINAGSFTYYIDTVQAKARRDDAPWDAVYERDGHWFTIGDVTNIITLHHLEGLAKSRGLGGDEVLEHLAARIEEVRLLKQREAWKKDDA